MGITRQRKAWQLRKGTFALPREIGQASCGGFCDVVAKATRRAGAMRSAGDCAWHDGSAGSEPAIKPERPETKGWLAKVGSVRKRASGAVLGLGDGGFGVVMEEISIKGDAFG